MSRALTDDDRRAAFIKATACMAGAIDRWKRRAGTGLTDGQLAQALAFELAAEAGDVTPDGVLVWHERNGLKIWISREPITIGRGAAKPTFEGRATVAMARLVYG